MGIILVIGMMAYSVAMCILFDRVGRRTPRVRSMQGRDRHRVEVVIPDHVPPEWVDAYRSEQGG